MICAKRVFCSLMALLLIQLSSVSAFALDSFISDLEGADKCEYIVFDEEDYRDLSYREAGRIKLASIGYSQDIIDSIPINNIEAIGSSYMAQKSIVYFKEKRNFDGSYDLVQITREQFQANSHKNSIENTLEETSKSISVTDIDGNVLDEPRTSSSVDGGTLYVLISLFAVQGSSALTSQYLVISEYSWTVSPNYRGTDYFGITRDSICSIIPNSFGGITYYTENCYLYFATNSGVIYQLDSSNVISNSNLTNEDSSAKGFVIKPPMPSNLNPPSSMPVGTAFMARIYTDMHGAIWYQGVLQNPNNTCNFNHWGTYWHQKGTVWGNISITVPFGASFTVSPQNKYSPHVEAEILTTWQNGSFTTI